MKCTLKSIFEQSRLFHHTLLTEVGAVTYLISNILLLLLYILCIICIYIEYFFDK